LKTEFRSFQSLVLQYLPPDAQARLQQAQLQPQPQSQQQNNEDEHNEESSPDYEDY